MVSRKPAPACAATCPTLPGTAPSVTPCLPLLCPSAANSSLTSAYVPIRKNCRTHGRNLRQGSAGYGRLLGKPEETANVLVDGWLRTGDVGFMDARGTITITDRKKDLIIVNGLNVYPNEIESVIASMPGVLECGVVGVNNPRVGEMVKAVIVKRIPRSPATTL